MWWFILLILSTGNSGILGRRRVLNEENKYQKNFADSKSFENSNPLKISAKAQSK